jgi:hypothetical protein
LILLFCLALPAARQGGSNIHFLPGPETTYKHSISTSGSVYSAGGANNQSSVTEVEEDSCPSKEFIGLKNGGPKNKYIVEGILFQSVRLWKGDQRWVVRKFRQT